MKGIVNLLIAGGGWGGDGDWFLLDIFLFTIIINYFIVKLITIMTFIIT